MTGETKEKTEPWVEEHKMQYDYGYMKKADLTPFMGALGMRGYPSAALVDPKGVVVWTGHPSSLNSGTIKKHLKGASTTPVDIGAVVGAWPEEAVHARQAFVKGQLAKALSEAKKLPQEWSVAGDVERVIERRVAKVQGLYDSGDYLGFNEAMKAANRSLAGLPQLAGLQATLKDVQKDAAKKKVMSAQKKLAKLVEKSHDLRKKKDADSLSKKIRALAGKNPGTIVEKKANALLEQIDKKRQGMR